MVADLCIWEVLRRLSSRVWDWVGIKVSMLHECSFFPFLLCLRAWRAMLSQHSWDFSRVHPGAANRLSSCLLPCLMCLPHSLFPSIRQDSTVIIFQWDQRKGDHAKTNCWVTVEGKHLFCDPVYTPIYHLKKHTFIQLFLVLISYFFFSLPWDSRCMNTYNKLSHSKCSWPFTMLLRKTNKDKAMPFSFSLMTAMPLYPFLTDKVILETAMWVSRAQPQRNIIWMLLCTGE